MALLDWLGVRDFLPEGPVLTPLARRDRFGAELPSGARYAGDPTTDVPVLPLQVFGVGYDLDLMLVSDHPSWNMHELARVLTPAGPRWLCKDAREHTLEQSIVAELDGIERWLPEVPVQRRWSKVEVHDRSTTEQIDLHIAYTNLDGEPTELRWLGPTPSRLEARRNTSTMGHSRDQVLAALDLSHKAAARDARITIGGVPRRTRRLLGVAPLHYALIQAQAGFSIGAWEQRGLSTVHQSGAAQAWELIERPQHVELVQYAPLRTLCYRFLRSNDSLELIEARVEQYGRPTPVCAVRFSPALPDLRRALAAPCRSEWVIDVNGQDAHAVGAVQIDPTPTGAQLDLEPVSPRWTLDRPMRSTVRRDGASTQVEVARR